MHQRIHAADMMLVCPFLATSRPSVGLRSSSALPPKADVADGSHQSLLVTQAVQKHWLFFLWDGPVGLDGSSGCVFGFADLFGSRGLKGRDLPFCAAIRPDRGANGS